MRRYIGLMLGLCLVFGASASQGGWMMRIHQGAAVEERALADIDSLTFYEATGACCAFDSTCVVMTQAACSGVWTLHGVCTPNPCAEPTGPCCGPAGSCSMTTQSACSDSWSQLGNCEPNPCPQPECYNIVFAGDFQGVFPTSEHSRTAIATEEAFDLLPYGPITWGKHCLYIPGYVCSSEGPPCSIVVSPTPMCTTVSDNGSWSSHAYCAEGFFSGTWDVVAAQGPCSNPGMIWIPPGNVRLGQVGVSGAEPVNDVYVDGFYIDRYEVSNAEYKAFIDAGGYTTEAYWNPVGWAWRVADGIALPYEWNSNTCHGGGIAGNEQFPVNGVSWWEADAYCRWAGRRLPTEAEWEKAAKGGCETHGDPGQCDASDTPTYPWGEDISGPRANYWYSGDPYEDNGWTTPVGYYDGGYRGGYQTIASPSPYGLFDVVGNVSEWCSTAAGAYPYDPNDGRENPPTSNSDQRMRRGGASTDGGTPLGWSLRCALREWAFLPPNYRQYGVGFRCAKTD